MNKLLERKTVRPRNYSNNSDGSYFVTLCTFDKNPYIKQYENIVKEILLSLPGQFKGVSIDYFTLMPDNMHCIFTFENINVNLGRVISVFKNIITIKTKEQNFWQRNYYEHVIRNDNALTKIRTYIQNNPVTEITDFKQFY